MDRKDLQQLADGVNLVVDTVDTPLPPIIKVIGVGGGGNNAINHMYNLGINDVTFVVINTDRQALLNSPVPNKVEIGDGLGAGADPEKGRKFAEDDADKISAIFDDDTKMVFITAGMGGGTGTGAGPVVARLAKERGLLTVGIVTIPFLFEGKKKILKALDGADEMAKYVDALLIINNERITEIYADLDFINAFSKADETLSTAAQSISEIIMVNGYINLDFNDVNTTLRNGGTAVISTGYGEGENRVTKAIEDALKSPLLRNRDILSSKHLLFNIYFSREADEPFKMAEAAEITDFISAIDNEVDVIWGVAYDDTLGNKVKMTILASGFQTDIRQDNLAPRTNTTTKAESPAPAPAFQPREASRVSSPAFDPVNRRQRVVDFNEPAPEPTPVHRQAPVTPSTPSGRLSADDEKRIEGEYGAGRMESIKSNVDRSRYVILSPAQMEDMELVDRLEHAPAYNRDKHVSDEIKKMGQGVADYRDDYAGNLDERSGNHIEFS